jgi:hypothetical protein
MIEDNAQAPFAMQGDKYTGTIGHIGVFSLNIHKHMQTGEGGVVVTDNPYYLLRLEDAINHGELFGNTGWSPHDEPIAALACAQLARQGRIRTASSRPSATDMVEDTVDHPRTRWGWHVYYHWTALVDDRNSRVSAHPRFRTGFRPVIPKPARGIRRGCKRRQWWLNLQIIIFENYRWNPAGPRPDAGDHQHGSRGHYLMCYAEYFSIGERIVGFTPTYFIADIGANHDGELSRATELIKMAKAAGADCAKFQHFQASKIVSAVGFDGFKTAHQRGWDKSVFEVYEDYSINRLERSPERNL